MIQSAQRSAAARLTTLVALVAAVALVLVGCSPGEKTETTFTNSTDGIEMTIVYYATGDKVTKQTTKNVMSYEAIGVTDKEGAQEALASLMGEFEGIDGLEHSVEYGDTSVTETMSVDFEVADIEEISQLPGSSFTGKGSSISLKESLKPLKDAGFTEVK